MKSSKHNAQRMVAAIRNRKLNTVPHQKIVEIQPAIHRDNKIEPYGSISRRDEMIAARLLNDGTASHILYCYFALNRDGHIFALSPTAIRDRLEVSEKQYHTAIRKLERAGYLVQSRPGSNRWLFLRVPKQYENIQIVDTDFEECDSSTPGGTDEDDAKPPQDEPSIPGSIDIDSMERSQDDSSLLGSIDANDAEEPQDNPSTPGGADTYPPSGIDTCTPGGIDRVPLEGERNITNITYNNTMNNTVGDFSYSSSSPEEETRQDEDIDNSKLENLITVYNDMFGYLEDSPLGLIEVARKAHKYNYTIKDHIKLLEKKIAEMTEERIRRAERKRSEYKCAVECTMPKDSIERMKVSIILNKFFGQHKNLSGIMKYGAWIDGWNEESQEPNIIVATNHLPLEIIQKQKHNLTGIPKEYYTQR